MSIGCEFFQMPDHIPTHLVNNRQVLSPCNYRNYLFITLSLSHKAIMNRMLDSLALKVLPPHNQNFPQIHPVIKNVKHHSLIKKSIFSKVSVMYFTKVEALGFFILRNEQCSNLFVTSTVGKETPQTMAGKMSVSTLLPCTFFWNQWQLLWKIV